MTAPRRITNGEFAAIAARLAGEIANWAADSLVLHEDINESTRAESLQRFLSTVRQRLDWLDHPEPDDQTLHAAVHLAVEAEKVCGVLAGDKSVDGLRAALSAFADAYYPRPAR